MAYGIVLVFEDVGEDQYWAVNDALGVARDGTGDWPEGLVAHAAGKLPTGLAVIEAWESKTAQEAFMHDRLGAALAKAGLGAPAQVIETEPFNTYLRP